ncbi:hypothetical protein HMPREF9141_0401 [Prevotella multiformis DSM 16608]|uniref:Uncharacterized protein n=1 Tax=Prevotella multiformis DSM 16608 TaxID=888743 RepID=F0F485_9BACT|nr:hypothetical protein HMPREF9141_0401 [Prevotella multiformis DSM 16608]
MHKTRKLYNQCRKSFFSSILTYAFGNENGHLDSNQPSPAFRLTPASIPSKAYLHVN